MCKTEAAKSKKREHKQITTKAIVKTIPEAERNLGHGDQSEQRTPK